MLKRLAGATIRRLYYGLINLGKPRICAPSGLMKLDEIKKHSLVRSEISDHLVTLFTESLIMRPKLIVELGVENGRSTFVFERIARLCNSKLISVDIHDCSGASSHEDWIFVQKDDIEFAKGFGGFCRKLGIEPRIDVLFIDTSHNFEHTLKEIEHWFPFMSERSKVIFHDTNLGRIYFRKDMSMGLGYNNRRGVIRALETYFSKSFDESGDFTDFGRGWLIRHYSHCNGLMILERGFLIPPEDAKRLPKSI